VNVFTQMAQRNGSKSH